MIKEHICTVKVRLQALIKQLLRSPLGQHRFCTSGMNFMQNCKSVLELNWELSTLCQGKTWLPDGVF